MKTPVCSICGKHNPDNIYYSSPGPVFVICTKCNVNIPWPIKDLVLLGEYFCLGSKETVVCYSENEHQQVPHAVFAGIWNNANVHTYPTVAYNRVAAHAINALNNFPQHCVEAKLTRPAKSDIQKEMDILFGKETNVNPDGTLKHSNTGFQFL